MPHRALFLPRLAFAVGLGSALLRTQADPIPGLFATGVDPSGAPLAAGATDPHWTLVVSPDPSATGPAAFVVQDGFPIPPWLANSSQSRWIAPRSDAGAGNSPGDYVYRLSFSLADFDPATAVVTGRWSSDNGGVDIRLNGVPLGIAFDGNFAQFSAPFEIRGGFVDGTNTLEFVVNNAGDGANPTGFRAELSGTADRPPAPGTPPVIVTEPADATGEPGAPLTVAVVANGARPLRYQWRFNTLPLSRATNSTYTIASMSAAWSGGYSVVVQNDWGAVTSRVARVALGYRSPSDRRLEPPGPSNRRTGIAFSEIHYNPRAAINETRNLEFVELYNSNPFAEELGGWRLSGEWDFTLPEGTVLGPRSHLVIAADPAALRELHGITNVVGGFTNRLANGGGLLRLRKPSGAVVLELEYDDADGWPLAADGFGHSLVPARPSLGEADPGAWRASSRPGGSPGRDDPDPDPSFSGLVLNEVVANPASGSTAFAEVFNPAPFDRDLSGSTLFTRSGVLVHLGPGSSIPALGWLRVEFPRDALVWTGEPVVIALSEPGAGTILDAVAVSGTRKGRSEGRWPDGAAAWRPLPRPTPAAANPRPDTPELVLNEIHYNPPVGAPDEFVEIHNPGTVPVSLGGVRLEGEADFAFPPGLVLDPGGFIAVARDPDRLRTLHPRLDPARVLGPFSGTLDNGGGLLRLRCVLREIEGSGAATRTNTFATEIEQVEWRDGGRWSPWVDAGGSSLERIDPRGPADSPDNWAASDESGRARWTQVEVTGVLDHTHPSVPAADQLQVLLLGAGEALLDDVEVIVGGRSVVANGGFESGIAGWTPQGTHRPSALVTSGARTGTRALRIVATDRGDHVANRIRTPLTQTIPTGTTVTIRAWVRWLRGHPEILLRLRNGGLEAAARLAITEDPGTPGERNSMHRTNGAPSVVDVRHEPLLPAAGQPVRVFARIDDPDGVRSVELRWRLDPSATLSAIPMRDDGIGGDERAGDGIFTALLPGQSAAATVAFHVVAADAAAVSAVTVFPSAAPARECLVRWGEPVGPGTFGTYRLLLTQATVQAWASREVMSNEGLDATFIAGTHRVIYGASARYSGSSYTAGIYNSPVGNLCGYDITLPDDDRFLGDNRVLLDWPIRDPSVLREQLMYWFLEQLGLPNMHRRHVHLYVNGQRRGSIYEDIQQPDSDTIREWFPGDTEGTLWKTDCWNEFSDVGVRLDPCILNTLQPFRSGGVPKVARYRWNWRPRAVRGSANDFSDLFALVDALNVPSSNLVASAEALVDVDHWMRTFAMNDLASFWDAFGNPNGKNTFLYKPERDRWRLMSWDFDVGLGVFNDPVDAPLFDVNDPVISRLYQSPPLVRRYWTALDESLNGFFRVGNNSPIDRFLDRRAQALAAGGVGTVDVASIKSWINGRRSFLNGQVARYRVGFAITSNGGADFQTADPIVTVAGSAPVRVASIRLNGIDWPVQWTTATNWSMRLALRPGANRLEVTGVDRTGTPVPGATDSVVVTATGTPPPVVAVRFNEWLASNASGTPDPADGAFDDWFELYNLGDLPVDLTGYTLTDDLTRPARFTVPAGFVIGPRSTLLVWADGQPEQTVAGRTLHVNFRLARGGSDLALTDPYGRRVDAIRFGSQAVDVSEGRWGDGADGPFFWLSSPTPGTANALPRPGQLEIRAAAGLGPGEGGVTMVWNAIPGRRYRIEMVRALASAWEPLVPDITADGATASAELPPADEPDGHRLFRVRLLP